MRSRRASAFAAGTGSEHDNEHRLRVPGQEEHSEERCRPSLLRAFAVVSIRVEVAYVGRRLLCGTTGPARGNGGAARRAPLDEMVRDEP